MSCKDSTIQLVQYIISLVDPLLANIYAHNMCSISANQEQHHVEICIFIKTILPGNQYISKNCPKIINVVNYQEASTCTSPAKIKVVDTNKSLTTH